MECQKLYSIFLRGFELALLKYKSMCVTYCTVLRQLLLHTLLRIILSSIWLKDVSKSAVSSSSDGILRIRIHCRKPSDDRAPFSLSFSSYCTVYRTNKTLLYCTFLVIKYVRYCPSAFFLFSLFSCSILFLFCFPSRICLPHFHQLYGTVVRVRYM